MPATEFLFKYCDGKFTDEDLSEQGNDFASKYYGDKGLYLSDYAGTFSELMYVAPESAHDFFKFSSILEKRFRSGVLLEGQQEQKKPWWQLW